MEDWSWWQWVGAWVAANAAYMAIKLIAIVVYMTTINYRAERAVPRLESLGYAQEDVVRIHDILHMGEGEAMYLWLLPFPFLTLPGWEVEFRRELRRYATQKVAVPRERRLRDRRHTHHRVVVGCTHRWTRVRKNSVLH